MNEERIKAAFRQVQEDCKKRNGDCNIKDKPQCKHKELCSDTFADYETNKPQTWNLS